MKCKRFKISGKLFADFLRTQGDFEVLPPSEIPADLEILSVERLSAGTHTFDNVFIVLFHSEEFPDIPEGQLIPIWEPLDRKE